MKFYGYKACSTCKKAEKYLKGKGLVYDRYDITETPPPREELAAILKSGNYKLSDLFNKSGQVYRELKMKDKIKTISENEALDLLAANGKLIKRPIVISDDRCTKASVGFKEEVFDTLWGV